MTDVSVPPSEELSAAFQGQLLREGDVGYDEARQVYNACFDRRPSLIARCTSTADVQAAVDYARRTGIEVAVRGGGHSPQGFCAWDEALMIDLSPMKGIEIDRENRIVRAEPGLTWAEFDAATQEHGLAVTGGRFSTTGIAGLTLGSGSGWLERRCGLTSDNLISAEVVTADGSVVTASADENPDLLWGLRGGSGNFGIVTSFTYNMYEIGPIIYGGMIVALPERGADILRFIRQYMADAPEDLNITPAFVSAPPDPDVPEAMHFAPIVGLVVCWTGPIEEGDKLLDPVREVAKPVMEKVGPMPYTALQTMLDASAPYPTSCYLKAEFLPDLTDKAIDKLIEFGNARPGPMVQLIIEPMGGAIRRTGSDKSALRGRDAGWTFHALSMWADPSEQTEREHVAWARGLAEEIASETMEGVYLNFTSDVGDERVRSSYGPEVYARLVALKDKYDPTNMFHLNQNIRPSNGAVS